MITYKLKYIFLLLPLLFISCDSDNDSEEDRLPTAGNPNGKNSAYVYSYWTTDYDQYIWTFNSLDDLMIGEINMKGKGIEQEGNMISVGNKFLASSTSDEGGRSYFINESGQLATGGREDRLYVESNYAYGITDDEKAVIIGASWSGTSSDDEVLIYDPISVSYTNRRFHHFGMNFKGDDLVLWPTCVTVSSGFVYIPYYPRTSSGAWVVPIMDTAYVKVLKYPSLEHVVDLKDTRTAPAGMYYSNTGIIRTDNGDVYTFSSNAYAAGFVPGDQPSGILRIKKGTTEFDKDYFLDIQNSKLQGKVLAAYYAEGSKVVVTYIPNERDVEDNSWAFMGNKTVCKSAVIDLESQEIIPVVGLPDHSGDNFYGYQSLYSEGGKAYKSYLTGSEARVYQIDLATGEAKQGALIQGGFHLPVISKLKY